MTFKSESGFLLLFPRTVICAVGFERTTKLAGPNITKWGPTYLLAGRSEIEARGTLAIWDVCLFLMQARNCKGNLQILSWRLFNRLTHTNNRNLNLSWLNSLLPRTALCIGKFLALPLFFFWRWKPKSVPLKSKLLTSIFLWCFSVCYKTCF